MKTLRLKSTALNVHLQWKTTKLAAKRVTQTSRPAVPKSSGARLSMSDEQCGMSTTEAVAFEQSVTPFWVLLLRYIDLSCGHRDVQRSRPCNAGLGMMGICSCGMQTGFFFSKIETSGSTDRKSVV